MPQQRAFANDTETAGVDGPLRAERDRLAVVLVTGARRRLPRDWDEFNL